MRRLHIPIAVAIVALLVPALAGAQAKKRRAVDIAVKAAVVDNAGGVNTVAGAISGRPIGSGAVVYRTRADGSELVSRYTAFARRGSIRGTTRVTPTPQPDGSTSFSGTLQVEGGTGRYRGARGRDLEIEGTLANNVFTFRITGTVRY
jgi:hypothetical protein